MRILIQLVLPGLFPAEAAELLAQAGAAPARLSHPELPGLFTAEVPDTVDVSSLLAKLNAMPALRYAEQDAWQQPT